jgi:hypothetical protein
MPKRTNGHLYSFAPSLLGFAINQNTGVIVSLSFIWLLYNRIQRSNTLSYYSSLLQIFLYHTRTILGCKGFDDGIIISLLVPL